MTFVLSQTRPVPDEVRRVLRELLNEAADHASGEGRVDVHTDVHELRKRLKKARAVLKLVRKRVPDYMSRKALYRDLGRRISAQRDAAAVIESLDSLAAELVAETSADVVGEVRRALEIRRAAAGEQAEDELRRLAPELRNAAGDLQSLDVITAGEPLRAGLKREYRRGRALSRALGEDSGAEEFHSWRKRAKEHRYHLELLLGEGSEVAAMHALTDLLGRAQDVTVLLEALEPIEAGETLREPLRRMRAGLQVAALDAGHAAYRLTPSEMADAVFAAWNARD